MPVIHKKLLVSRDAYETRVAVLENSSLAEFYYERADQDRTTGNIYKGRVMSIVPGIEAAFVDIGLPRNAFLYVTDVAQVRDEFELLAHAHGSGQDEEEAHDDDERVSLPPVSIQDVLKEGQEILVQMQKEPIGAKGCRVSTNITLPGRYLVLLPVTRHVGISRRIEDEAERARLLELVAGLVPAGMGAIVRTAGAGMARDAFASDIEYLSAEWEKIVAVGEAAGAPALVHQEVGLVQRMVRDALTDEVGEIIVDHPDTHRELCDYLARMIPRLAARVVLYSQHQPLFRRMGIETEISNLRNRKVWLNCGGYVVIDETEALTAIDVNTGRYVGKHNLEETVFHTNMEAAVEIARQLRLRDIGGIIIIDFIDMKSESNQQMLLSRLKEELRRDRARTNVLDMTQLGLVQMTRKRVRKSLYKSMMQPCPYCKKEGSILSLETMVVKVMRRIAELCAESPLERIHMEVHPRVASKINEEYSHQLAELEERYKVEVKVLANPELHFEEIEQPQESGAEAARDGADRS
ncbi:Rne/Rng family ribonuclease [bacterium]|nr:Rne/Rng family ribonuclease [bacterium]